MNLMLILLCALCNQPNLTSTCESRSVCATQLSTLCCFCLPSPVVRRQTRLKTRELLRWKRSRDSKSNCSRAEFVLARKWMNAAEKEKTLFSSSRIVLLMLCMRCRRSVSSAVCFSHWKLWLNFSMHHCNLIYAIQAYLYMLYLVCLFQVAVASCLFASRHRRSCRRSVGRRLVLFSLANENNFIFSPFQLSFFSYANQWC